MQARVLFFGKLKEIAGGPGRTCAAAESGVHTAAATHNAGKIDVALISRPPVRN